MCTLVHSLEKLYCEVVQFVQDFATELEDQRP